jgi:hypothetical protein
MAWSPNRAIGSSTPTQSNEPAEPGANPRPTMPWRAGAVAPLEGGEAKKKLHALLGVKRAAKKPAAKKSAAQPAPLGGSALGPLADGRYVLACTSGDAKMAIEAIEAGAQRWAPLDARGRSPELFALARGESMAAALQAAGPAPKGWLAAHGALALEAVCASKSLSGIKMLLAAGADPDATPAAVEGRPAPKAPIELALARRWDAGALALARAGARLEPVGEAPAASAQALAQAWRARLGRSLATELEWMGAEWERRALGESLREGAAPAWNFEKPEFQATREAVLGDGSDALLPGIDWDHVEPGEIARRLKLSREREKDSAARKPKKAAKRV